MPPFCRTESLEAPGTSRSVCSRRASAGAGRSSASITSAAICVASASLVTLASCAPGFNAFHQEHAAAGIRIDQPHRAPARKVTQRMDLAGQLRVRYAQLEHHLHPPAAARTQCSCRRAAPPAADRLSCQRSAASSINVGRARRNTRPRSPNAPSTVCANCGGIFIRLGGAFARTAHPNPRPSRIPRPAAPTALRPRSAPARRSHRPECRSARRGLSRSISLSSPDSRMAANPIPSTGPSSSSPSQVAISPSRPRHQCRCASPCRSARLAASGATKRQPVSIRPPI